MRHTSKSIVMMRWGLYTCCLNHREKGLTDDIQAVTGENFEKPKRRQPKRQQTEASTLSVRQQYSLS